MNACRATCPLNSYKHLSIYMYRHDHGRKIRQTDRSTDRDRVRPTERQTQGDRQTNRQTERGGRNRGGGWGKREYSWRWEAEGGGWQRSEKTYLSVVRFHRSCKYVGMINLCRHGMHTIVKLLHFCVDSVHADYSCPENRNRSEETSHV